MRIWIPATGILLLLLFIGFLWFALYRLDGEDLGESSLVGKPLPSFRVEDVYENDKWIDEKRFTGQMFAVNFFASWCVPCRAEHPLLELLDMPIIGIAWKDKNEDTKNFIDELGPVHTLVGQDFQGEAMVNYGILGIPETIIVGKDGLVLYHRKGVITPRILKTEIQPLLEKEKHA